MLQWIINVCAFVIKAPFSEWARYVAEQRNVKMAEKRDLNIDIDPDLLAVFNASTAISTQKGSSAGLLKVGSKRRRTKAELEELKVAEIQRGEALDRQAQEIAELKHQLADNVAKREKGEFAEQMIEQMMEAGALKVNEKGGFDMVQMQ